MVPKMPVYGQRFLRLPYPKRDIFRSNLIETSVETNLPYAPGESEIMYSLFRKPARKAMQPISKNVDSSILARFQLNFRIFLVILGASFSSKITVLKSAENLISQFAKQWPKICCSLSCKFLIA